MFELIIQLNLIMIIFEDILVETVSAFTMIVPIEFLLSDLVRVLYNGYYGVLITQ